MPCMRLCHEHTQRRMQATFSIPAALTLSRAYACTPWHGCMHSMHSMTRHSMNVQLGIFFYAPRGGYGSINQDVVNVEYK
eukprot:1142372-Pelagomonas_calceolata.AAC.2